jgi:heterodisulfide reductase subunit C2
MPPSVTQFNPELSQSLIQEVMHRSGQNLLACYQCRQCAAGCPVGDETGMTPDRLIRTIVVGDREKALNNMLVWKCVACYMCGTRCPNNIQTARINETLKEMSKEDHLEPLLPKVAAFHGTFMRSASHLGRINEIEFMGLYELQNAGREIKSGRGWKAVLDSMRSNAKLAISMLKKKRLHFRMYKIKDLSEIKRLYTKGKS